MKPEGANARPQDDDRRQYRRFPVTSRIAYRRLDLSERYRDLPPVLTNISEGGIFIPSKETLPTGTILDMEVHVTGRAKPIRVIARVAWVSPSQEDPGMGVCFTKTSPEVREEIVRLSQRGEWKRPPEVY